MKDYQISCNTHGPRQRGWIVCTHCIDGAKPAHCGPDPDEPAIGGSVLCQDCLEACNAHKPPDTLRAVCHECVKKKWPQALN